MHKIITRCFKTEIFEDSQKLRNAANSSLTYM